MSISATLTDHSTRGSSSRRNFSPAIEYIINHRTSPCKAVVNIFARLAPAASCAGLIIIAWSKCRDPFCSVAHSGIKYWASIAYIVEKSTRGVVSYGVCGPRVTLGAINVFAIMLLSVDANYSAPSERLGKSASPIQTRGQAHRPQSQSFACLTTNLNTSRTC